MVRPFPGAPREGRLGSRQAFDLVQREFRQCARDNLPPNQPVRAVGAGKCPVARRPKFHVDPSYKLRGTPARFASHSTADAIIIDHYGYSLPNLHRALF